MSFVKFSYIYFPFRAQHPLGFTLLIILIPISFRELLSYLTSVPNLEAEAKGKRTLTSRGDSQQILHVRP